MQTLSVIEDSMLSLYLHNVHGGVNVRNGQHTLSSKN